MIKFRTFLKNLPQVIRDHGPLILILTAATLCYVIFPLRLQAMEPYSYASAIEKYYNFASTFALSRGEYLPDFGRYHPNHPLGHAIAGFAFDWFHIPALIWMQTVNAASTLAAVIFLYIILMQMKLSKSLATITVALFLATNGVWLAVLSGEWHIPALALTLAGISQIIAYINTGQKAALYRATLLFGIGACYHLNGLFMATHVGLMLLFFIPLKERRRELFIAAAAGFTLLFVVYVVIPFLIFRLNSFSDFMNLFLIYSNLRHIRYAGFEWPLMALRSIFHGFLFTPAGFPGAEYLGILLFTLAAGLIWKFARSTVARPIKIILFLLPVLWFIGQWLLGARADALNGWLFIIPFLCVIGMHALGAMNTRKIIIASTIPLLVFIWNFSHAVLPNSMLARNEIFFFNLPAEVPKETPVAFVVGDPVFSYAEFWHAGSELGYRRQALFLPCCGENNYHSRLRRWMRSNPGFIVVSDGGHMVIENLLRAEGHQYARWLDRHEQWPASRIPATVYVPRDNAFKYDKRLTIWRPLAPTQK